nr:Dihydrofolate reductase [uncultured bacterium]
MKTFIIAAITADGFIARDAEHTSTDWTSPEDSQLYRQTTKEAGVMVMGSTTFATIMRSLPGRKTVVYTTKPERFAGIEDVETTREAPAALVARLEAEGYSQAAICGGSHIYRQFLAAGVVDELYLTVEPVLFGTGIGLFNDKLDVRLELLSVENLNENTLQLKYKVIK